MCISSNVYTKKNYEIDFNTLADLELVYNRSAEPETKEEQMALAAELWLEGRGITVKTDYGYYRSTFDILKDFGEYLSNNDRHCTVSLVKEPDQK